MWKMQKLFLPLLPPALTLRGEKAEVGYGKELLNVAFGARGFPSGSDIPFQSPNPAGSGGNEV